MGYDQAFFAQLNSLLSDTAWELTFERPTLDFDAHGLKPSYCHSNVEHWIETRPGWRRVRGWLVSPYSFGLFFAAHSLAEGPRGELWDVTPYLDERTRDFANRFVKHPGSDEQFDLGVTEHWGKQGTFDDPDLIAQSLNELGQYEPWPAGEGDM
ncbi:MAG: hypothetical protein Q8R02_08730 [Hyphomonadaceae bacterium]|nr:hypothetical protein [Hyphomonadaceae bacterium]